MYIFLSPLFSSIKAQDSHVKNMQLMPCFAIMGIWKSVVLITFKISFRHK
jgi:hypothetical protein